MRSSPPPEAAIARWLAHGMTSATHPVLAYALRVYLNPLGIEAAWLEAEPFSALESGQGEWWLRTPRWNPARFDPAHPAAADFACLLSHPGSFQVAVDDRGIISPELAPAADDNPEVRAFMESGGGLWPAVCHTLRAAHDAEKFLHAASGLILANEPIAAVYALGDDDAFCAAVHLRLRGIPGDQTAPPSRTPGDAAGAIGVPREAADSTSGAGRPRP